MNYIVFDLEFNQLYTKKNEEINTKSICEKKIIENSSVKNKSDSSDNKTCEMPFEIIQIGAVKLNDNFEIIATFNRLIKPSLYNEIHPFIEELTGINTEMVATENHLIL